jgi:hypothetical protein
MKNLKTTFAILVLTILSISCSKDDDNNSAQTPAPVANDNFIRCKVDGVNYEITGNQIFNYKDASGFNIAYKNTLATTGIDMAIAGEPIVKTYTFNNTNLTTVGRLQYNSPDTYTTGFCDSVSGTLTITAKNGNTIQGTFSFTAKRLLMCTQPAKTITEGTFKITY